MASVENLIEMREEFEKRIRTFFKETVREQNTLLAEEECHQLLDTLKLTYPIAERFKIDGDKSTIAESL